MPGPIPKRDDERRRRNKPEVETTKVDLEEEFAKEVTIPVADPDWHEITTMIWESLPASGQARFYEPSDWAAAYLMCESIDRDLKPQVVGITDQGEAVYAEIPLKGASLSSYIKMMTALVMTEGDRRRARMEIERGKAADIAKAMAKDPDVVMDRAERFRRKA